MFVSKKSFGSKHSKIPRKSLKCSKKLQKIILDILVSVQKYT